MIWELIKKYFNKNEKWGKFYKMNHALLYVLFVLREKVNKEFIINCGYEVNGHASNSYHSKSGTGSAVDFHIKDFNIGDIVDIVLALTDMNVLYGLGYYPYSNTKFLHLDLRSKCVYWYQDKNNEYVYFNTFSDFVLAIKDLEVKIA